jgi:hypothetical protein
MDCFDLLTGIASSQDNAIGVVGSGTISSPAAIESSA